MLAGENLRITRITSHIPLREVPERITEERVFHAIRLTHAALEREWLIDEPRIVVCGLNPHAGEKGLFGNEEARDCAAEADDMIAIEPYERWNHRYNLFHGRD
jgi:4-hydroxythreonine-4-phosphate dehydrogenase